MSSPENLPEYSDLCSIVIPVFNRQAIISETVRSCVVQDHPHIEIIIVDDGSTDRSLEICRELAAVYAGHGRIFTVITQKNQGACTARNRGMSLARGKFLLFLDSDDLIPANKLSLQIAAMERSGADCCISDYKTIDEAGRTLHYYRNNLNPLDFVRIFRSPSNSAIVLRRSTLPRELRWNESLRSLQDFDFMLRYLTGVKKFIYLPRALYYYRLHSGPRISDSYVKGVPYVAMFWSMTRYLWVRPPASATRRSLLFSYAIRLSKSFLKDVLSQIVPRPAKRILKRTLGARRRSSSGV